MIDVAGQVEVVLCHPTDPRNVGGVIRAVANHGLAGVRLVTDGVPDYESYSHYSSFALDSIRFEVFESVRKAIADCRMVLGTSRRTRDPNAPPFWPAAGLRARLANVGRVALVFGTERTGLTREELDHCDAVVAIPTTERFASMNLSHAVACLGYELARPESEKLALPEAERPRATAKARDAFFVHVHDVVASLGYPPGRTAEIFTRRLRQVVLRANPSPADLGLLAGIFSEMRRLGRMAGRDT